MCVHKWVCVHAWVCEACVWCMCVCVCVLTKHNNINLVHVILEHSVQSDLVSQYGVLVTRQLTTSLMYEAVGSHKWFPLFANSACNQDH